MSTCLCAPRRPPSSLKSPNSFYHLHLSLYPIARLSLRRKAPFCLGNCQPVFIVNGGFPSQLLSSVDAPVDSPDGRCNCSVVSIVLVSQNLGNKKQPRVPFTITPDSQRTLGAFFRLRARSVFRFPRTLQEGKEEIVLFCTHTNESKIGDRCETGVFCRGDKQVLIEYCLQRYSPSCTENPALHRDR